MQQDINGTTQTNETVKSKEIEDTKHEPETVTLVEDKPDGNFYCLQYQTISDMKTEILLSNSSWTKRLKDLKKEKVEPRFRKFYDRQSAELWSKNPDAYQTPKRIRKPLVVQGTNESPLRPKRNFKNEFKGEQFN